ncbi:MAG: phosphotransferase [Acidobacteria bacterium]|nr:phosphotransferase [Acidobacteriota bacterium]
MTEPIENEEQLTPEWLTERLRRRGHLARGRVARLSHKSFGTFFSQIYRLEVLYSNDAAPALPNSLLLKVPFAENEAALKMGLDEVEIYQALTATMADPPVVRCFDSVLSQTSQKSHLLLEDLSETHFQPELPVPPSLRHCELCVETLAQFHAFWWNHPGLGTERGVLLDAAALEKIVSRNRQALSGFVEFLGDRLSKERRIACEEALAFLPAFWERRLMSVERNTLIHGDAHLWNFLHPKDVEHGRAYLIDLATTNRIRPPTNDLAYMMALQWFPARRALMEESLLGHYHRALLSHGVTGYSWEDCLLDYRYSVMTHLFTPVQQWDSKQIPAMVWWHNFERISEAYKDLRCGELVSS